MRRKIIPIIISLFLLAALADCSSQIKKEDEARAMVASFQTSLGLAFDGAKAYVTAHPEKQLEWKTKVVPMFDLANKILADLETKGKAGQTLTVLDVTTAISQKMADINSILIAWGVLK